MISQEVIEAVAKHQILHEIGYCSCPCFDALVEVGKALAQENELRRRLPAELLGPILKLGEVDD